MYEMIKQIKQRPGLYLKEPSLLLMKTFLDGYSLGKGDESGKPNTFLSDFQRFVEEYYGERRMVGWDQIISEYCASNSPLDCFFILVDEFVKENMKYK